MTKPKPKTIMLGACNCHLLPADGGWVLVDTGYRGWSRLLARSLAAKGIAPSDIRLIVVTHAHFDHVGGLAHAKALCGCPVAVHAAEADLLARGESVLPPGIRVWSRELVRLGRALQPRMLGFEAVRPDVIIEGSLDLSPWGLDAVALHTPGHTAGSISVITAEGTAVVGDLCINVPLYKDRSLMPPFAHDTEAIVDSWRMLLGRGVRRIRPAHGRPFDSNRLAAERVLAQTA